jgi:hypothetical protein
MAHKTQAALGPAGSGDARVQRTRGGASEIMKEVIARSI